MVARTETTAMVRLATCAGATGDGGLDLVRRRCANMVQSRTRYTLLLFGLKLPQGNIHILANRSVSEREEDERHVNSNRFRYNVSAIAQAKVAFAHVLDYRK